MTDSLFPVTVGVPWRRFPPSPMTFDDFQSLCAQRRSIRYFDDKPVKTDVVTKLLEVARLAPSVENLQPWKFHVVTSPALRKKLMEASCYGNFVEGAGVFIVITSDTSLQTKAKEPLWNPRELEYSCIAAAEHMMLAATAMGLGSCWVSLHHGVAHEALDLPRNETVVGGLMLGYFKHGEEKASAERERKPVDELAVFHN